MWPSACTQHTQIALQPLIQHLFKVLMALNEGDFWLVLRAPAIAASLQSCDFDVWLAIMTLQQAAVMWSRFLTFPAAFLEANSMGKLAGGDVLLLLLLLFHLPPLWHLPACSSPTYHRFRSPAGLPGAPISSRLMIHTFLELIIVTRTARIAIAM